MDEPNVRVVHAMYGPGVFLGEAPNYGGDACAVEFDRVFADADTGYRSRLLIVHARLLQPEQPRVLEEAAR